MSITSRRFDHLRSWPRMRNYSRVQPPLHSRVEVRVALLGVEFSLAVLGQQHHLKISRCFCARATLGSSSSSKILSAASSLRRRSASTRGLLEPSEKRWKAVALNQRIDRQRMQDTIAGEVRGDTRYLFAEAIDSAHAGQAKVLPTPPKSFTTGRAIFWFKSSAQESIRNIWELVHLLQDHGHYVEVHKCRRLGNILWEDKFQVAAFPSKLDGRITVQ
jgi:hypothetical protein